MKRLHLLLVFCVSLFSSFAFANTQNSLLEYLNLMRAAHQQSNYELLYVLQQGPRLESFRYRHLFESQKEYAHLQKLDGAKEEIILRHHTVSYLREDATPFSIQADNILDNLPSIFHANFDELKQYQFEELGIGRVAGRVARIVHVKPVDTLRYGYTLWIDEESHLLLQSVLVDPSNERIIEQFKVVSVAQNNALRQSVQTLEHVQLPALAPLTKSEPTFTKQTIWVPNGFKLIKKGYQTLAGSSDEHIIADSYLYSDGLFTFNIYILPNQGVTSAQLLVPQGKLSLLSQTVGKKDIVVIGDIPEITAKAIIDRMR